MSGASVASAWASPALSLAFMILVVLSCSGHVGLADAAADVTAWDASRPFALRALGVLIAVAIAGSASAASVAAVAGRSNPDDIPTFTMSQRETVSALSSPIVSAVASQAQRSPRAGRILVLDGDPTNDTVNATLWRGNGASLTASNPAVRALVLAEARSGAATGSVSDPATASLAQAAYTLVVYPDDATVQTLAAHDIDTILVPLGASGSAALTSGLDRAEGLEKVGDTTSGTVWRVRPGGLTPARVRVESASGVTTPVGSSQLRVDGDVDAAGTLVLAERADPIRVEEEMTKPRISSLTTLVGAGIAVAAMASASVWVGASPSSVDGTAQSAHPSQVRLACPSGIVDPFETTSVAAGSTWSSLASAPTNPAPASITGNGGVIPTALTLAGQGGGELAGLSAVGCAAPRTSQWIATGATTSGADMVLILSNPGPTASVVSIDGYGASGPLNTAPRQVTVPASSSVSVLLAGWFPDENSLALHVRADGGGVAAWVQASLMNGEIPQGTTLASAVVPATSQTILGVDPKGTSLLRLVSPSGERFRRRFDGRTPPPRRSSDRRRGDHP